MARIPATFWAEFTAALPKASFEDISEEFSHLMLVKSDEELAQVRYAAQAAEAACKVVVEVAAPGVGEEVILAEATREMLRYGIGLRYPMIVMNSGPAHAVLGTAALDDARRGAAHPATRRPDAGRADADVRQSGSPGADDGRARSARRDQPQMRARRARMLRCRRQSDEAGHEIHRSHDDRWNSR